VPMSFLGSSSSDDLRFYGGLGYLRRVNFALL
jgi:hypothetical protein